MEMTIQQLEQIAANRQTILFVYVDKAGNATHRRAIPQDVRQNADGSWSIFSLDCDKNAIRQFKYVDMSGIRIV